MVTMTGLQSPNPYAQAVYKPAVWARTATPAEDIGNHAVAANRFYSPDWMQEETAAGSEATPVLYGAKGETQKLPLSYPAAHK